MKKKFILLVPLLLLPSLVSAFSAQIVVDTGTETINALEGTLEIPFDISISDIYTGSSIILFWIEKPILDAKRNTISFAGLTPGGFRGRYPVFSISGEFSRSDLSRFGFNGTSAFKHDGSGTAAAIRFRLVASEIANDSYSPEPFKPIISSSPDIFEGRHFLSFAAQDKGTGIEHYEAAFTWFLNPGDEEDWQRAQSPLVLSRLQSFQRIHVRAVDKAGNHRDSSLSGPYHYAVVFIGILMLLCILLYLKRLPSRRYPFFS